MFGIVDPKLSYEYPSSCRRQLRISQSGNTISSCMSCVSSLLCFLIDLTKLSTNLDVRSDVWTKPWNRLCLAEHSDRLYSCLGVS